MGGAREAEVGDGSEGKARRGDVITPGAPNTTCRLVSAAAAARSSLPNALCSRHWQPCARSLRRAASPRPSSSDCVVELVVSCPAAYFCPANFLRPLKPPPSLLLLFLFALLSLGGCRQHARSPRLLLSMDNRETGERSGESALCRWRSGSGSLPGHAKALRDCGDDKKRPNREGWHKQWIHGMPRRCPCARPAGVQRWWSSDGHDR